MTSETLLPSVEIEPEAGKADAAVVWLHGLGADGHDFGPIVPELGLPPDHRIRFVFPHAPRIPVTLNMGWVMPAWYDIYDLDDRSRQDEEGIRKSAERIRRLLEREFARGIPANRIVLAGFSQGGAIAAHLALRYDEPLGGLLVLSSWLPLAGKVAEERSEKNLGLPILWGHGTEDTMVPVTLGEASVAQLKELGYSVEWHTWPMAHEVCMPEIQLVGEWLCSRLPVK